MTIELTIAGVIIFLLLTGLAIWKDTPTDYVDSYPYITKIVDAIGCGTDEVFNAVLKVAVHVAYPKLILGTDFRVESMTELNAWIKDNWKDEWITGGNNGSTNSSTS